MIKRYCFLCASDDGIFLDITADNRQVFHEQFEICSFVKVLTEEQLPTKICHKCVYELKQCSSFIEKCSLASHQKGYMRKNSCSLCREQPANDFIFNITTNKGSTRNLYDELNNLNIQIKPCRGQKLICLSCRYTLDVLRDLKNVYKHTSAELKDITNEEIDYQTFPKVKTIVVSRKTTVTESTRTDLYESEISEENNLIDMTRTRSQDKLSNNKPTEKAKPPRLCTKCKDPIKDSDDTFKTPRGKHIICKSCWNKNNVDTSKDKPVKAVQPAQQTITETKQCTVYLKDVLKDAEVKDKVYKTDKTTEGKKTSVATDKVKESITEQKPSTKASNDATENTSRHGQKRSARLLKTESESSEDTPNKKHKPETKPVTEKQKSEAKLVSEKQKSERKVSESETKPFESTSRRLRQRREDGQKSSQGVDSDSVVSKISEAKRREGVLTRHKRATCFSLSDADVDNKRDRKKLRSILRGIPVVKNTDATSDDVSSNEEPSSKKRSKLSIVSSTTSDSEKSQERLPSRKSKAQEDAKSTSATFSDSQSSEAETTDDLFEIQPYVCDDCGASYENKLMGLTHKLTHYKQPKVSLEKLSEESLEKLSEESVSKEVAEPSEEADQTEEPSENIVIAMEEDEEEAAEEAIKLSTNEEAEASSDTESKAASSKKEAQEDDVDVSLVMKESDDDQTQKNEEKEAEESRADEDAEMSVPQDKETEEEEGEEEEKEKEKEEMEKEKKEKKTRRSRSISKDTDKTDKSMRESTEDENANSEEKQDSLPTVTEEVQGEEEEGEKEKDLEEEKSKEKPEDSDEDKAEEEEVSKEATSDEEKETEESTAKASAEKEREEEEEEEEEEEKEEEVTEKSARKTTEEEKEDEGEEVEEKQTEEEEETEDSRKPSVEKEDEEESKEEEEKEEGVKEVANEEEEEEEEKKDEEDEEKKEEEEEEKKEEEEKEEKEKESKRKDSESEKVVELEEEEEEEEETEVICDKEAKEEEDIVEILDEANSSKLKDTDDCTIVEDEAGSLKKGEQNNVGEKEAEDDEEVVEFVKEVVEQKSPKRTSKRKSVKKDEAESKRDSKETEVVEEIVLSEESNPLDKDDDDVANVLKLSQSEASKLEKSTSDSANAAAEVLQEVLALASAEVQKREETMDINMGSDSMEAETLENISRELQNTVDMPPLKMDDAKSENDICVK